MIEKPDNSTYMGIQGNLIDELHEAFNGEDLNYVARRGFAVSDDLPLPDVQFPFITISGSRTAVRVRNTMKDVHRGVQLHLNETESHYAELEITRPTSIVDAVIKYAEAAELAEYNGLTHTGPMPVYALCMKDAQIQPILSELETRMTTIREEAKKSAEEPPAQ